MQKRKSTRKKAAAAGGRKQGNPPLSLPRVFMQMDDGSRVLIDDGKPTTDPQRLALREQLSKERQQRWEAWKQERNTRLNRRPVEMQRDDYTLPTEVMAFLERLRGPISYSPEHAENLVSIKQASVVARESYLNGCKQGFIEGFLYGEEKARPGAIKNRERLRQQNLEKLARLGIEDRNAEIIAEFERLARKLPGKEQRYEHLARVHDLTTRQIGNIIRANKRRPK